jgi:hypothetical protein
VQGGSDSQADLGVVVNAVYDDRPDVRTGRHEPGGHRAQLAAHRHVAERQAAGFAWAAGVDAGFEAGLGARNEIALNVAEATRHRYLVAFGDRPDHRVPTLPGEAVEAGPEGGLRALQGDAVRPDGLDHDLFRPRRVVGDDDRGGVVPAGERGDGEQGNP